MKMSSLTRKFYILEIRDITREYFKGTLTFYLLIIHSVTKTSRDLNPFVGRPGMMILQNWIRRTPCY